MTIPRYKLRGSHQSIPVALSRSHCSRSLSQAKQGKSANGVVGGCFDGWEQGIAFVHGAVLRPQLYLVERSSLTASSLWGFSANPCTSRSGSLYPANGRREDCILGARIITPSGSAWDWGAARAQGRRRGRRESIVGRQCEKSFMDDQSLMSLVDDAGLRTRVRHKACRSHGVSHPPSSPQHKKPEVQQDDDAEWTRVERRKARQARKREAKRDVRPLHVP